MIQHNTDMEELNERFRIACHTGKLAQAQQLWIENPNINISSGIFIWTCVNGHLEVAQWLLQVKPDINILAYAEEAFYWTCENGHLEVAQWLADEVKPERYEITEVTTDKTKAGKYNIKYKIYPNNDRIVGYILK